MIGVSLLFIVGSSNYIGSFMLMIELKLMSVTVESLRGGLAWRETNHVIGVGMLRHYTSLTPGEGEH